MAPAAPRGRARSVLALSPAGAWATDRDLARVVHMFTIAWSEFDRTIPFERYGRPMLARVPGATHLTLPGVGHVLMLDDPALVVRTIKECALEAVAAPTA